MNIEDINDALGEAPTPPPTPRQLTNYEGPINENNEPDTTTSIVGSVGTMTYRSHPLYKHYTGQWTNGVFEGNGKLIYQDGDVYTGHFLNGVPSGYGHFIYKTGDHSSYTGEFLNGNVFNGTLNYKNGDIYRGPFLNGLSHGWGVGVYIHNRDAKPHRRQTEIYNGEFRYGQRNGNGTSTYYNVNWEVMHSNTGVFKDDNFVLRSKTLPFKPNFDPAIPLPRGASRAGKRRTPKTVKHRRLKRKYSKRSK
jgi:hypothetical protein